MSDYRLGDLQLRACPFHMDYEGDRCQVITFQTREGYRKHLNEHWKNGEGRKAWDILRLPKHREGER